MRLNKLIALFAGIVLLISLAACGSVQTASNTAPDSDAVNDSGTRPNSPDQSTEPTAETGQTDLPQGKNAKIAVVVFSATGTTKGVADKIAALTGADIMEIIPALPYSAEDLNYNDSGSRTSKEQNDPNARPEIAEEISLDGYTTVYLGYPIWWGQAPRILSTFAESHDFTGITVIPFCTSGSSDIGQSDDALAEQAGSGTWLQGKRFSGSAAETELQKWINDMGETAVEKTLRLHIGNTEVSVEWEDNESVGALIDLAKAKPIIIDMSMYGGFEQVGSLGAGLPRNDEQTTTEAGDIVLYDGNSIVVFYGSNSWAYTRLGRITNKNAAEMTDLLGGGDVTITISYGG